MENKTYRMLVINPGSTSTKIAVYENQEELFRQDIVHSQEELNACPDKTLVGEISAYLMLAVYKMYRLLYGVHPKNSDNTFTVDKHTFRGYSNAAMQLAETRVEQLLTKEKLGNYTLRELEQLSMTGEKLAADYPLYATSLANLVKASEERIRKLESDN